MHNTFMCKCIEVSFYMLDPATLLTKQMLTTVTKHLTKGVWQALAYWAKCIHQICKSNETYLQHLSDVLISFFPKPKMQHGEMTNMDYSARKMSLAAESTFSPRFNANANEHAIHIYKSSRLIKSY